jgi:hypothetical protein
MLSDLEQKKTAHGESWGDSEISLHHDSDVQLEYY